MLDSGVEGLGRRILSKPEDVALITQIAERCDDTRASERTLDHRGPARAAVLPRVSGRCVKGPARVSQHHRPAVLAR